MNLAAITKRKYAYTLQQVRINERIEQEKTQLDAVTALLLQITMLELAEVDPRITHFSFDATYEYDDEGGYFWTASFFAWDAGESLDPYDSESPSVNFDNDLRSCGGDASSIALAFGSGEDEGQIGIADLRAQFAGESKCVMPDLTIICSPATGLLYESNSTWVDAGYAFRERQSEFKHLSDDTRLIATPDGCTVGDNADLLTPGEYVQWNWSGSEVGAL